MPETGSPGGRKGPERVEVIYFPKRVRALKRRTLDATEIDPHSSRTIEFRPFADPADDVPTEPIAELPAEVREELQARDAARSAEKDGAKKGRRNTPTEEIPVVQGPQERPSGSRSAKGRDGKRRGAATDGARAHRAPRRRPSVEIDTDPALRYHVKKLDQLLKSDEPAEPLRAMTRLELAEMALFGHQLFESGRLDEARVVFEGLVALGLQDAFPHTMLGTVYLAMGKQDRAMALFEAALGIDPDDVAARVYRSEIRINKGQIKLAVEELERVIASGSAEDPFVERARRLRQIVDERSRRRK